MVGGQTVDIESEGSQISKEKLEFIYRLKTSALLEASMLTGAILAGASEEDQQLIERAAAEIGFAFQIRDDILDITSSLEVLGKPVGSDEKNQKATYAVMEGIEAAEAKVQQLSIQAMERIHSLPQQNLFLSELLRYLIHREK